MKQKIFLAIVIFNFFLINTLRAELKQDVIKEAYLKSYQYEKMGNYADAIKALQLVYNHYNDGYTVNLRLGFLYCANAKYANSTMHYLNAIQTSKYAITPKLGIMLVRIKQGQYEKAEEMGYQILNSDYYNYYGNLRMTFLLRQQKKYELAEKISTKMLALYPADAAFLAELGIIKYLTKEYKSAKLIFSNVLVLDPENVTAKEYLILLDK